MLREFLNKPNSKGTFVFWTTNLPMSHNRQAADARDSANAAILTQPKATENPNRKKGREATIPYSRMLSICESGPKVRRAAPQVPSAAALKDALEICFGCCGN